MPGFKYMYMQPEMKQGISLCNFKKKCSPIKLQGRTECSSFHVFMLCLLLLAHFFVRLRSNIPCQACKAKCTSKPPGLSVGFSLHRTKALSAGQLLSDARGQNGQETGK